MFVKVAVIYSQKSKGFVSAIKRARNFINDKCFDLNFYCTGGKGDLPEADMIMVDGFSATEYLLDHYDGLPIILLEKADSASVFFRKLLKDPRVDMMLKGSKLHPANENFVNYRFEELYSGGLEDDPEDVEILSNKDLQKIEYGPNFYMYDALGKWQNFDEPLDVRRKIDVHCVCSTEKYSKNIKAMRKKAVGIVNDLSDLNTITGEGKPYNRSVYREQLLDTKIVVCPFGNGYMSYRMAEAMLAGCVVVCPDCDFAVTSGSPLIAEKTYIPCKPDYTDLEDCIKYVLNNWDGFLSIRQANQKLARKLYSTDYVGELITKHLTNLYVKLI